MNKFDICLNITVSRTKGVGDRPYPVERLQHLFRTNLHLVSFPPTADGNMLLVDVDAKYILHFKFILDGCCFS